MRILLLGLLLLSVRVFAQVPPGYYDPAQGLSGQELRATLKTIISNHTEVSYASIWTYFQSTDATPDDYVWDMYSDIPGGNPAYTYTFVIDQCGNYGAEGDCYNREHSFPKSWFNDAPPMLTDLFHIYPTDGYVNGMRSNYPYGDVGNATWTSTNGSKLGTSSVPGYSGTVFEPIDQYKGDFARTYFYMLTCYMDQVSSWNSDMLSGSDFSDWARELLLEWDAADPVSEKEIDRNNAVYQIQDNRNPFIDHPEYASLIWGSPTGIDISKTDILKIWYSGQILHIILNKELSGNLSVTDMLGHQLKTSDIQGNSTSIPCTLSPGIYIIRIETKSRTMSFKLVVPE